MAKNGNGNVPKGTVKYGLPIDRQVTERVRLDSLVMDNKEDCKAKAVLKITDGFKSILDGLRVIGYPTDTDPNFIGTYERAGKALMEMVRPKWEIDMEVNQHCAVTFPSTHNDMLMVPNIPAYGICPHHLLPIMYEIAVAYIPGEFPKGVKNGKKNGKDKQYQVLGLSKIPRIVQIVARQPLMQETLAEELADIFYEKLNSEGSAVYLRGRHGCMECRGVNLVHGSTVLTALRGHFYDKEKLRAEFVAAVHAEMRAP